MLERKYYLKTNPVGKSIDNTAKKFFRLYDGTYNLLRQIGKQTFIVYDDTRQKELGKYHASSLRKFYE